MYRVVIAIIILVFVSSFSIAQETKPAEISPLSANTENLYKEFIAAYEDRWPTDSILVDKIMAASDGDMCFLKVIDAQESKHSIAYCIAVDQLGKLNTQRTFDLLAKRLKSSNWSERQNTIYELHVFKRPECVTLLVGILSNDPMGQIRFRAAEALVDFKDPQAEPELLKAVSDENGPAQDPAALALATMNSKAGLEPTIRLLRRARTHGEKGNEEGAILAVGTYQKKIAVHELLDEYEFLLSAKDPRDGWTKRLTHDVENMLIDHAVVTSKLLGPNPDTLEQWKDWWAQAEPLLTDDLQLKDPEEKPREYRVEDFGNAPEVIDLTASVDAKEYRIGDPIRLDLQMVNHSKKPYSVVMPELPSGWWPTMAYGIRLKRGSEILLDLAPTDFYLGSYSGPPGFQTLAPEEAFRDSICLQYFLHGDISRPLPAGDYELAVAFDSSKFAGIRPQGVQLVHRWDAKPIQFTIKGEARMNPTEILRSIGEKTKLRWLESDLISPQSSRRERAWRAVFQYGDSRLEEFVAKIEKDHPESSYYYLSAKDLRPYQYQRPKP
jgi:hypothetical protein